MKKLVFGGLLAFSLFGMCSCGDDDSNNNSIDFLDANGDGIADPAISCELSELKSYEWPGSFDLDPIIAFNSLTIENASKKSGTIHTKTGSLFWTNYQEEQVLVDDSQFVIEISPYDLPQDALGVYVEVEGAADYYSVPISLANGYNVLPKIPVTINQSLGDGKFEIKYCVFDEDGDTHGFTVLTVFVIKLGGNSQFVGDWSLIASHNTISQDGDQENNSKRVPYTYKTEYMYTKNCHDQAGVNFSETILYDYSSTTFESQIQFQSDGIFKGTSRIARNGVINIPDDMTSCDVSKSLLEEVKERNTENTGYWSYDESSNIFTIIQTDVHYDDFGSVESIFYFVDQYLLFEDEIGNITLVRFSESEEGWVCESSVFSQ